MVALNSSGLSSDLYKEFWDMIKNGYSRKDFEKKHKGSKKLITEMLEWLKKYF